MTKPHSKSDLYIGLMSGTSMDSVDAVIVSIKKNKIKLIASDSHPIDTELRHEILSLCQPGENAIYRMGRLDVKLGRLFADCVKDILKKAEINACDIAAIGSHGQNIRHRPDADYPFTLQIGDPNTIAAETGITTIADFRRRDIALGGQGAPLAPAFHQFLFQHFQGTQWVLNIGGIANVTLIQPEHEVIGFDTGPGNTLMDAWHYQHCGQRFDNNGMWAKTGTIHQRLLSLLLNDPFFSKKPPKSTGLEHFNLKWLQKNLRLTQEHIRSQDVQATLLELTVQSIAQTLNQHSTKHIWVCGGGAKNQYLMERLQSQCHSKILSTDAIGIPTDWIEACAFAWMAHQTAHHRVSNIPSVTGAKSAAILGAIYCA